MVNISVTYAGNKKCDLVHPEGAKIRTDAPRDIGGDASGFSPTDLVAAGLASCILTTIAMYCERQGLDVSRGMSATVEKHMSTPPAQRRIARLPVAVTLPASIPTDLRERVERIGHTCPVHATLHPEVEAPITYTYA